MPVLPLLRRATNASNFEAHHLISSLGHLVKRIFSNASKSAPQILERHTIESRQSVVAIPTVYQGLNAGPPPGEVAGIVLGSVAGFFLLIWLFSSLANINNNGSVVEEEVVVRRSRSPRSRPSRRSEMASRSPRPERIIRQERIVRDSSRAPPPRSSFVVEEERRERRVDGDDIVEVIEENSSVGPRRKSKRSSGNSRYR